LALSWFLSYGQDQRYTDPHCKQGVGYQSHHPPSPFQREGYQHQDGTVLTNLR
jgi:hypothetical protein